MPAPRSAGVTTPASAGDDGGQAGEQGKGAAVDAPEFAADQKDEQPESAAASDGPDGHHDEATADSGGQEVEGD